jgi:transposase
MWQLPKGRTFLANISAQRLKKLYDKETNAKAKIRLLSAIQRKNGKSIDEIAYLLAKNRRTIHSWLVRFNERGIDAKDSKKAPGKLPSLTAKQRRELITVLERGPPHNPTGLWSTKEVRELIAKKYRRTFVKQHVWRMLVTLGYSMQRPRKQHYKKPDEKIIRDFKKKRGKKQDTIAQKDLLWVRKMKQPPASSRSSREGGQNEAVIPL